MESVRRSRRSTAGNRMEQVLAELKETQPEPDEDVDFEFKDEEDVFESDFESTDEEAAKVDKSTGEQTIQEEEMRVRKTARSKLERATALAHARQKATFNPQAHEAITTAKPDKRPKHGIVIDSETGEITETNKRKSERVSTVLNRTATFNKYMKDAQERKATKRPKTKSRPPTQDELMRRALDMEEGNIIQHRDYLVLEEEKRKLARVVRPTIEGPLLRWISKVEEEPKSKISNPPFQSSAGPSNPNMMAQYNRWDQSPGPAQFIVNFQEPLRSQYPQPPTSQSASVDVLDKPAHDTSGADLSPSPSNLKPVSKEKVEKNYVVLETRQSEKAPLPTWKQTMEAMFGDHVRWDELKVYSGKNRPLSRPKERCPITGLAASYCDPRTGVPYANVHAYREISKVLEHKYVWSAEHGCYVGREDDESGFEDEDEGQSPMAYDDPMVT